MKLEKSFIIDVINLMPEESIALMQAPSLEVASIVERMEKTEFEYYNSLSLSKENKELLIQEIINNDIQDHIHSIEIRNNGQLLFEGFDGVEFGTISKHINLPVDFSKYITEEICTISNEW